MQMGNNSIHIKNLNSQKPSGKPRIRSSINKIQIIFHIIYENSFGGVKNFYFILQSQEQLVIKAKIQLLRTAYYFFGQIASDNLSHKPGKTGEANGNGCVLRVLCFACCSRVFTLNQ